MELPNEQQQIEIEPGLRKMILIEIIFPMVLLILGIYHGLMQVLYRAGMIRSSQFLGLEYFQGLTLHGVVNAIVFTTFFAVAFGYAIVRYYLRRPLNMKVAWLSFGSDGRGHPARGGSHSLRQGDRALHFLSAAARASRLLCRPRATRRWFLDRVLQLVAALLRLETRASGARKCRSLSSAFSPRSLFG